MQQKLSFLKKNLLPVCCIVLGCLIFFWVRNYPEVPSGIGPAFFPKVVAVMLILFSVIYLVSHRNKVNEGEVNPDRQAWVKIALTTGLFIGATVLMQYVHVVLGIFVFLFAYLMLLAKEKWIPSLLISAIGTAVLYGMVVALRIPM